MTDTKPLADTLAETPEPQDHRHQTLHLLLVVARHHAHEASTSTNLTGCRQHLDTTRAAIDAYNELRGDEHTKGRSAQGAA